MSGDSDSGRRSGRSRTLGVVAYVAMLVCGIGGFLIVREIGERNSTATQEASGDVITGPDAEPASEDSAATTSPDPAASKSAKPKTADVIFHVLATLSAVILLGYGIARALRWVGQPPVIGEILAGIALGPSLLGLLWPDSMHVLLPATADDPQGHVAAALKAISQLGVVLYMFVVGLELNSAKLKHEAHSAVAISHVSIVLPFLLGATLALWLYGGYAPEGVSFTSFALFLGVAMSITAFPVLARILTDRGLERTRVGSVALACAAADDVTAWCLLALVIGIVQSQIGNSLYVGLGALAFIAAMFFVVRPIVERALRRIDEREESLPTFVFIAAMAGALICALATEAIGIHAIFGAFLLGAVIPHDSRLAVELKSRLRDAVTILLLPAFFAYTGMRTQIGLVSGRETWLACFAIIAVATAGKFGGTLIAARATGSGWRQASALGVLMNTRGLMELIVLNIGLDLGVISPKLFAMMVLMAIATTVATGPILSRLMKPEDFVEEPLRAAA